MDRVGEIEELGAQLEPFAARDLDVTRDQRILPA